MKTKTTHHGFILMNTGAPIYTQEVDVRRYHKEIAKVHHSARVPCAIDAAPPTNASEFDSSWFGKP